MGKKVVAAAMVGTAAAALAKEVASAAAATIAGATTSAAASAKVATAAASAKAAASACSAANPITDPIVDAPHDEAPNGGGFAAVLFDEDDPKDAAVFDEDDPGSEDDGAFEKDAVVSFEGALAGRHIDAVALNYDLSDPLKVGPPSSCIHQPATWATCDTTPHGSPRRTAWCCTTRAPTTMVEAGR